MKINILDCTLRDGGYYNKWDFDKELVHDYLYAMKDANIDFVELGLRQFDTQKYLGASAYTTHEYLNRLSLPNGPTYGVMVDAKTILADEDDDKHTIDKLFKESDEEKIGLVRIAAHFHEAAKCASMISALKEKGYIVGLNIMQASLRSSEELSDLAKVLSSWNNIDVLYFADSLGSMKSNDIERVYNAIRHCWSGDIGFHAHNNMGEAISNVNCAIDLGCSWVDGTVTGMGRGAGNAELEFLLDQSTINKSQRNLDKLDELIINYFEPLKQVHNWGVSMGYYRSAQLGIHPSYIQELLSEKSIDRKHIPRIINDLGKIDNRNSFNKNILEDVISKTDRDFSVAIEGNVPQKLNTKEVVLVAQTQLSQKFKYAIKDYIKSKKATLISINLPKNELDLNYDYVAISHNQQFRNEGYKYQNSNQKFIAPKSVFTNKNLDIEYDYGLCIKENVFECKGNYVVIPSRLTIAYAIGFCIDAKVEKISLVGFGGYTSNDLKQKEMQELLSLIKSKKINIQSLTPTSFAIPETSIFCV